jgi:CheY-like chemotaxis protein
MSESPRIVFCVDDDADDREMLSNTIYEIDPSFKVVHAENGEEAIEYLSKAKVSGDLPCLVILDLNMPKMDGRKTLAEIKKDEQLSVVPLVILSTSSSSVDKIYCAHYGVELVTKPSDILGIHHEVKRLLQYCGAV